MSNDLSVLMAGKSAVNRNKLDVGLISADT